MEQVSLVFEAFGVVDPLVLFVSRYLILNTKTLRILCGYTLHGALTSI
jgi:hypothetical protein